MILLQKKWFLPFVLSMLGVLICMLGLLYEWKPYREAQQLYQGMEQMQLQSAKTETVPEDQYDSGWSAFVTRMIEEFPDMAAWLRSPDGTLDYPVVQGEDNVFYLTHLADGSENKLGAIFLDCQANDDFSSSVSVIYGHAARGGQMFGSLNAYKEQEYYDANPVLQLYTAEAAYEIELLAAYLADGAVDTYPTGFQSEEEKKEYLQEISERSFFKSAFAPEEGTDSRLVILSTCTYEFEDARLALVGQLREITVDDKFESKE